MKHLRSELDKVAHATDDGFPENRNIHIEHGEPVALPSAQNPLLMIFLVSTSF